MYLRKSVGSYDFIVTILLWSGDAQYTWNCSSPNERGERFIPGVREYPNDALTNTTAGDVINIYRVQTLNAECFGEVTAIEFCYRYSTTARPGEAVFNWTVLIFEETAIFTVTKIYILESRPGSLHGGECVDIGGGRAECCDRQPAIDGFDLQNGFIFGVTESAQGNTAGASLLGFLDDPTFSVQPEYTVFMSQSSYKLLIKGLSFKFGEIKDCYKCARDSSIPEDISFFTHFGKNYASGPIWLMWAVSWPTSTHKTLIQTLTPFIA